MENNLNTISEQKLEKAKRINTIPDEKSTPTSGGKPGEVKDMRGYWNDEQIANNPIAYIQYLGKLLSNEQNSDRIKEIISEIKEVKEKYFSEEFKTSKSR